MRRLLVLVCVLAFFAVVSYFGLRRSESNGTAALGGVEDVAAETKPAKAAPAALAPGDEDASLATPATAAAARGTAPETIEAEERVKARTLRGAVIAPSGCGDPAALVIALESSRSFDEYVNDASAELAAKGSRPAARLAIAQSNVGADGRFELVLPEGKSSAYLLVVGDYWRSPRAALATPGTDATLTAECGARVEIALTLPESLRAREAELEGLAIEFQSPMEVTGAMSVRRTALVASGRAVFGAVDPRLVYDVEGKPELAATFWTSIDGLTAGRTTTRTIALETGGTLRGVVRSKDGAPLAGAKVEAKRPGRFFGFDDRAVRASTSGADGAFDLQAVSAGKVSLVASLEGYLASDAQKLDVQTGGALTGLEIVLDAGATIAGTLVWPDGTPAAEIEVEASLDLSQRVGMNAFNARRGTNAQSKTNATGGFELHGLEGGPFVLSAEAVAKERKAEFDALPQEERSKRRADFEVRARLENVATGATDVRLELREPLVLLAKVVDQAGAPVTSFKVTAEVVGDGPLGGLGRESVKRDVEDETGALRLALPTPGKWKLTVRAKGFADVEGLETNVPRAEGDGELVVTLERQCVVSGFVRATSGAPIADAEVWQTDGQPGFMRQIQIARGAPVARSDAEGRFRLERLKSGRVNVVADHREHAKSVEIPLELAAGEEHADVVLVLREGGTLTGEVYGDGKPLAGHLVQATDLKAYAQNTGTTDAQGRFRFEHVEPGGYQVVAMPAMGDEGKADATAMFQKMKMTMCDVREGELTHVVLGAAPQSPVKLRGRVTHAGEPYGGATLSFVAAGKNALAALKMIQVGSDGAYAVTLDKPGEYVATVQKFTDATMMQQNATEFACTIPEAPEHELDFELPTGRVSGRITLEDRSPAAGVRVSVLPGGAIETGTMWGGQYHELVSDSDGNFDAQALRPGKYTIAVGGATLVNLFGGGTKHGRELRDVELSVGEWERDVDFRLRTPGTAAVTVVDEAGAAVEGASVFARDERGKLLDRLSFLVTDASGVVKYAGLSPGKYYFSARKEGVASAESALVEIRSDEVATAKVQVAAATRLLVRIEEDDKPVRAQLSVLDASGREHAGVLGMADVQALFAQDGFQPNEVRVGPLAPGKYVVRATVDGKKAERSLTLNGSAEKKITLELR